MHLHYHTSIDHIVLTTIEVVLAIQVARWGCGALAKSSNPTLATIGKSVGAIFTFGS